MTDSRDDSRQAETSKGKSPAFQFYPKDFLTDAAVLCMTNEEIGMYIKLLCVDWLEDGFFETAILKLAGFEWFNDDGTIRDDSSEIQATLAARFSEHPDRPGRVTNRRLYKIRKEQVARSKQAAEAGQKGGKARAFNALSAKQSLESRLSEVQANPSSSSSSSSSSANNKKEIHVSLSPDLHSSPEAPKHLRRFKTELKQRGSLGAVWVTDEVFDGMATKIGIAERDHLVILLERYSTSAPKKFKAYTDHARVMAQFRQRALEDGKSFRIDDQGGPGYYRPTFRREYAA